LARSSLYYYISELEKVWRLKVKEIKIDLPGSSETWN